MDELLSRSFGGSTGWYLTDRLGSVRQVANLAGVVSDAITYDGFGNVVSETMPSFGDRFKWTGREWNGDTGLQYNRARYFLNETGRWLNEDPIRWDGGDANLYRYTWNATQQFTDPSGNAGSSGGDAGGGGGASSGLFWNLGTMWTGGLWGGTPGSGGGNSGSNGNGYCYGDEQDYGDGFGNGNGVTIFGYGGGHPGGGSGNGYCYGDEQDYGDGFGSGGAVTIFGFGGGKLGGSSGHGGGNNIIFGDGTYGGGDGWGDQGPIIVYGQGGRHGGGHTGGGNNIIFGDGTYGDGDGWGDQGPIIVYGQGGRHGGHTGGGNNIIFGDGTYGSGDGWGEQGPIIVYGQGGRHGGDGYGSGGNNIIFGDGMGGYGGDGWGDQGPIIVYGQGGRHGGGHGSGGNNIIFGDGMGGYGGGWSSDGGNIEFLGGGRGAGGHGGGGNGIIFGDGMGGYGSGGGSDGGNIELLGGGGSEEGSSNGSDAQAQTPGDQPIATSPGAGNQRRGNNTFRLDDLGDGSVPLGLARPGMGQMVNIHGEKNPKTQGDEKPTLQDWQEYQEYRNRHRLFPPAYEPPNAKGTIFQKDELTFAEWKKQHDEFKKTGNFFPEPPSNPDDGSRIGPIPPWMARVPTPDLSRDGTVWGNYWDSIKLKNYQNDLQSSYRQHLEDEETKRRASENGNSIAWQYTCDHPDEAINAVLWFIPFLPKLKGLRGKGSSTEFVPFVARGGNAEEHVPFTGTLKPAGGFEKQAPKATEPGPAKPVPGGTATGPGKSVPETYRQLPNGRNRGVKIVPNQAELDDLFDKLSQGGEDAPHPTYEGPRVKLPDGTYVGKRPRLEGNGPTIDIEFPDGTRGKIHIEPWPPKS